MKLLIVGCGYVGSEVRRSIPDDWSLVALTRSPDRGAQLRLDGILPVVGDWQEAASLQHLPEVDAVLVSVPHRPHAELEARSHQVGLRNLLERLPGSWQKLVYLSTTGVYGDGQSDVVDEETPVSPTRIGAEIAVQGENWLRSHLSPDKFVVLRLAGIYGPGRIPLAEKLKAGEPLAVPQEGFLNLAHVADIARLLVEIFSCQTQRSCYVFSDGTPVPRLEFYGHLARLCGVEQPRFIDPNPTDSRKRRATSKRVNPSRIVRELGFEYHFADYRSGLIDALGC